LVTAFPGKRENRGAHEKKETATTSRRKPTPKTERGKGLKPFLKAGVAFGPQKKMSRPPDKKEGEGNKG